MCCRYGRATVVNTMELRVAAGEHVALTGRVLFADEPSAALDFDGQEQVANLLAGLPVTLVVISHDHAVTRACNRVTAMAAGRLRVVA